MLRRLEDVLVLQSDEAVLRRSREFAEIDLSADDRTGSKILMIHGFGHAGSVVKWLALGFDSPKRFLGLTGGGVIGIDLGVQKLLPDEILLVIFACAVTGLLSKDMRTSSLPHMRLELGVRCLDELRPSLTVVDLVLQVSQRSAEQDRGIAELDRFSKAQDLPAQPKPELARLAAFIWRGGTL